MAGGWRRGEWRLAAAAGENGNSGIGGGNRLIEKRLNLAKAMVNWQTERESDRGNA